MAHKHFITLHIEQDWSSVACSCAGCGSDIAAGAVCARGVVETCGSPGDSKLGTWCWPCFVKIGKAIGDTEPTRVVQ